MSHRLGVATASALLMVAVGGCATERDLGTNADGRLVSLPEDTVRVGDRWVRSASLEGEIAGEAFNGQARVQAFESDYGHIAIELALPTERGAVMHLIELDRDRLDGLTPGASLTYAPLEEGQLWPLACAGPDLDNWEVDVPIQFLELEVSDGDRDGQLWLDWSVVKAPHDAPELLERSRGRLLLDDNALQDDGATQDANPQEDVNAPLD